MVVQGAGSTLASTETLADVQPSCSDGVWSSFTTTGTLKRMRYQGTTHLLIMNTRFCWPARHRQASSGTPPHSGKDIRRNEAHTTLCQGGCNRPFCDHRCHCLALQEMNSRGTNRVKRTLRWVTEEDALSSSRACAILPNVFGDVSNLTLLWIVRRGAG